MNKDVFISGIENIYDFFGRKKPEPRHIEIIFRQIKDLPDSFMDFAVKHLEMSESLPRNMGRYFFRELWPEYLERNPEMKKSENSCCLNCDPDLPGWRKIYKQETTGWGEKVWKPVIVRCTCGNALNPRHEPVYSDFELENMGYKLKLEYTPEQKQEFEIWRNCFKKSLEKQDLKIQEQEAIENAMPEDF